MELVGRDHQADDVGKELDAHHHPQGEEPTRFLHAATPRRCQVRLRTQRVRMGVVVKPAAMASDMRGAGLRGGYEEGQPATRNRRV